MQQQLKWEIKKQLNRFTVFIRWLPLALPYWIAGCVGATWKIQVQLLPPPRAPLIFWVKLASITLETTRKCRFSGLSFVRSGEWDRENVRKRCSMNGDCHEDSPFKPDFDTVRDLCVNNLPLEQIDEYQRFMRSIDKGKRPHGYRTRDQVREHFNETRQANLSIATEGYKTSASLGGMERDEISIWVTRDGQLVYGGWGNHRLAMADLHNIDRVPVSLLGAHPEWLNEQCRLHSLPPHKALQRWIGELR